MGALEILFIIIIIITIYFYFLNHIILFFKKKKKKIFYILKNVHVQQSTLIRYTHSENGIAALKHSNTGRGPLEETRSSDPSRLPKYSRR